jgi:hypothetical protein
LINKSKILKKITAFSFWRKEKMFITYLLTQGHVPIQTDILVTMSLPVIHYCSTKFVLAAGYECIQQIKETRE